MGGSRRGRVPGCEGDGVRQAEARLEILIGVVVDDKGHFLARCQQNLGLLVVANVVKAAVRQTQERFLDQGAKDSN
jgi:hypothetical protein